MSFYNMCLELSKKGNKEKSEGLYNFLAEESQLEWFKENFWNSCCFGLHEDSLITLSEFCDSQEMFEFIDQTYRYTKNNSLKDYFWEEIAFSNFGELDRIYQNYLLEKILELAEEGLDIFFYLEKTIEYYGMIPCLVIYLLEKSKTKKLKEFELELLLDSESLTIIEDDPKYLEKFEEFLIANELNSKQLKSLRESLSNPDWLLNVISFEKMVNEFESIWFEMFIKKIASGSDVNELKSKVLEHIKEEEFWSRLFSKEPNEYEKIPDNFLLEVDDILDDMLFNHDMSQEK